MPERKQHPKVDHGPDYLLRVTDATGRSLWHQSFTQSGFTVSTSFRHLAGVFKGPGLARAERALRRRGYVVQRVMVEA